MTKSKKHVEEETEPEESALAVVSIDDIVDQEWTTEDLQVLIEAVEHQCPRVDKTKYTSRVAKINWEEVKFKDFTAEECKEKFSQILERLRKFRTLSELIVDAKEWSKKPWTSYNKKHDRHPDLPKKPLTPYLRFYVEKSKALRSKNPTFSMADVTREAASKFKALSEKKRKKYNDDYEREMEEWRQKMAEFREQHPNVPVSKSSSSKDAPIGPAKAKTPFDFFKLKKLKNAEEGTSKQLYIQLRKEWQELSSKKKCKFIEKSLKDERRYKAECEEYKKDHPTFSPSTKSSISKNELEMLKIKNGKPEKPPNSGYGLFSRTMLKEVKDVPSKEKMSEIAKRWKSLPESVKQEYNFNAAKMTAKYVEKFQKYLDSIPEELRDQEMCDTRMKLPSAKKLDVLKTVSIADSSTRSIRTADVDSDEEDSD
ncbi:nucleolar transcription factor 1-A-like isoform X2 [Leptotrombidium deliense]|uniref:Nucleolar transcription factor 1-A-like isoform X2 n=1 Tax=Leptotrombidium deliense TaxID=299467 RepID=A0A443SQG1_9ACAR|nr:nucleolar transcription factor 1-A-like isoform X2 [Leptotrombidium deliense]